MNEHVGINTGIFPDFAFTELQIPVVCEFEIKDKLESGKELQEKFAKSDLRKIESEKKPFPGLVGVFVCYRPEFNDLYISAFSAKLPGRSMILMLDDQGLPRAGRIIDDPIGSLVRIFKDNGLPVLAKQMSPCDPQK